MKHRSRYILTVLIAIGLSALAWTVAQAHFQELLPTQDIITTDGNRTIDLDIIFSHPMANGPVMNMGKPKQFGVLIDGRKTSLLPSLKEKKVQDQTAFSATYTFKRPGDHIFYIEPAPYWEPAEEKMIVHYTKVVVDAFGEEEGWDSMVGFPVEIEPLVRPYGLWTGNLFRGIVRHNGKPVPFAEIEVEYLNSNRKVEIPNDAFLTQVIKADGNGVFAYAMPRAGWWAFAALVDGDAKMKNPDGKDVDVELGGLIWVKCVDMKIRNN